MAGSGSAGPEAGASLRVEQDGNVTVVHIARPAKRNALDDATVLALEAVFTAPPEGTGAFVIAGEGDHFCAGLDLSELKSRDVTAGLFHSRMWHRAFQAIEFGTLPVVAVLKGAVIGGGLELAAAAHIRVAESSTFYALPEGQRGIFVGGGASVRLPRLIGVARMRDMMMTGRTYRAEEGVVLGFSQYLEEPGAGLAKAVELARKAAGNAPLTNFALIHALPRIAESDPASGYVTEALMAAVAQGDAEAKRRLADFLEKRAEKVRPS
jgi:enoyl-CoA hydratase/carnithine racemase